MTTPSISDLSALREVAEKHPGAQYLAELEASAKMVTHWVGLYAREALAIVEYLAAEKARADAAEAERDESARAWRESFDSMHRRAMTAEATIASLTEQLAEAREAREALKPFADWKTADGLPNGMLRTPDEHPVLIGLDRAITAGEFRRARAALSRLEKQEGEA